MVWCGMEVCHFALPLQQIVRQLSMHTRQQRCLECVFQYRWKSVSRHTSHSPIGLLYTYRTVPYCTATSTFDLELARQGFNENFNMYHLSTVTPGVKYSTDCCKYCSAGKTCGDTRIKCSYTCHVELVVRVTVSSIDRRYIILG